MALYRLRREELPNLEERLRSIVLPVPKENEILDVETFALASATPQIVDYSIATLSQRVVSEKFRKYRFFFDKQRAFTYFVLHSLGVSTILDYVDELSTTLKKAQDRLTRFLSMYAPGSLTDIEGQHRGTIDGEFIQQGLSFLFTPSGFNARVDIDSKHHVINYGHEPLDLPSETGKIYLEEMAKAILNSRTIYEKMASALIFVTELDGISVDLNEQIQRRYDEVKTQVDAVNVLLRDLAISSDTFKTSEGIKKFVALNNALGYLIRDIPLEEIKNRLGIAYQVYNSLNKPFSNLPIKYRRELESRENLGGALDILPLPQGSPDLKKLYQ